MKKFKPNLIPNNPKDASFDLWNIIKERGVENYLITFKKDGCRLELVDGKVLTRSLKAPGSRLVVERFQKIASELQKLNIVLEGEFYMHGLTFSEIFSFFSREDVTASSYRAKLQKEFDKDHKKFFDKYNNRTVDFLTTFHYNLNFWMFDGYLTDRPDLTTYKERIAEIMKRIEGSTISSEHIVFPEFYKVTSQKDLNTLFENALRLGYEGLVLTHKNHEYKMGRNTLKQGTLLKMKNDKKEFDGIILDVLEGTKVKGHVQKTINELGRSVTSKKKDDRESSGIAKGFLVSFENKGTFVVGLRNFDEEEKRELLRNKKDYIGKHFTYTAMPPVKDFPRHAYFSFWRDEK